MDQMVAGITAGGDHGAVAAAVHGDGVVQRGRRKKERRASTVCSPGMREGARRRRGQPVATTIVPVGRRTEGRKTTTAARDRAS